MEHTVSAYDDDLKAIARMVTEIGGLAERAVGDSVAALTRLDLALARKVIAGDKDLDRLQREIEDKAILADSDEVAQASKAGGQLIDARPVDFYVGLSKKSSTTKAGHIAGAVVLPPEARTRASGGAERFLDRAQYEGVLKALRIDPAKPSIAYCNTGHLASGAWFVMNEVLGVPSKVYDGSMHEWTAEDRPVVGLPNK